MALLNQNIRIYKGDDIIVRYTIEDLSNLTGYKAYWSMAVDAESGKLIVKTTEGDYTEEGGITLEDNYVNVLFESEDTDETKTLISVGEYYCELQLEDGDGKTVVAAEGTVHIRPALKQRGV
jgi:hypothetical protein